MQKIDRNKPQDSGRPAIAYLGIGSNMGDPVGNCREAVRALGAFGQIEILRRSSLYRTEPVGEASGDWFVNAVLEVRTRLTPLQLLKAAQWVEQKLGRVRTERWGPRVIDIDILLFDQQMVHTDALEIPHREMHKRRFVLEPLCEIAPYAVHPLFGLSVRGLLDRLGDDKRVEHLTTDW